MNEKETINKYALSRFMNSATSVEKNSSSSVKIMAAKVTIATDLK